MSAGQGGQLAEAGHLTQNLLGQQRVLPDPFDLGLCQRTGFVEDAVGDRQLAEVVQERSSAKLAHGTLVEAEERGDRGGDLPDAVAVLVGPGRFGVDHGGEALGDSIQPIVIGAEDAIGWLDRRHVRLGQRRPEPAVRMQRTKSVDEHRIEPLPAAPPQHPVHHPHAAYAVEHLRCLGEAENPREQWDLGPTEPAWLTLAVPVLVQGPDRLGCRAREAELVGDVSAPITSRLHQ